MTLSVSHTPADQWATVARDATPARTGARRSDLRAAVPGRCQRAAVHL